MLYYINAQSKLSQTAVKDTDIAGEDRLRRAIDRRVKINHLRVFLEVSRHESVSKAAAAMHLAQPAATKTLREFEEVLGTELFERHARGVVLNEAGRLVIPHVQAIFADLARIGDQITAYRNFRWSGCHGFVRSSISFFTSSMSFGSPLFLSILPK